MRKSLFLLLGFLYLIGCEPAPTAKVTKVETCIGPEFLGRSAQCRVILDNGKHATVIAPVIEGDTVYYFFGAWRVYDTE